MTARIAILDYGMGNLRSVESETPFYFVHSFAPRPGEADLLGTAAYGARFACAAERDNAGICVAAPAAA